MKLNAVYVAVIFLLAVGIFALGQRVADGDAALRNATDSADARVARLAAEVFAAEARESAAYDTVLHLRRERATFRAQAGAERLKSDSLLAFALHMDSIAVPRPIVLALVASLHAELALHDSVIKLQDNEIQAWIRMYASADSGRAALYDALETQRSLTHAWKAAARPPLFSLRRFKVGPGCAVGVGGSACGISVSYAF